MVKLTDAFTQIMILGFSALCCPGLFNALNGLGAAGSNDPKYANQANTALYACFAVFGYFGGAFFNVFGNRVLLCAGAATYSFYSLGMYLSGNVEGAEWVAILAGIILGIGAGLFWTAQGAMMMCYSTPYNKGNYIGWFWIIFNLGGVLGGLLQFLVNINATGEAANANAASYFTFVAVMLLGAIVVPFCIVNSEKVVKADGTPVVFEKGTSWVEEIKGAIAASFNKYMLLLFPFFIASNWFYTYQFNFVNGSLFNIRTRGFNSCVYWAMQMVSAWAIGYILDMKSWTRRQRAVGGWLFAFITFVIAWALGAWVQYGFEGGYDKDRPNDNLMDVRDSKRNWAVIFIYCLYGIADAALQAFSYWIMGAIAGSNTALAARFAGFYKGVQSLGAAVAWGIDLSAAQYRYQFWIGFGLWAAGSVLAYFVARDVKNEEEETVPAAGVLQKSISGGPIGGAGPQAVNASTSLKEQEANKLISNNNV